MGELICKILHHHQKYYDGEKVLCLRCKKVLRSVYRKNDKT